MVYNNPIILVVEDDKPIRNLISTTLEMQKYKFFTAENGETALMQMLSRSINVVLLDLGLPDMDGIEVIKKIRAWSTVSIIVISARSEDRDKIEALDAGADDYLTKPFSVEELLARLRSTVRRLNYLETKGEENAIFENGMLKIDYGSALVEVNKKEIHLMPMEYSLICLLAKNVGKVLTYSYILDHVWNNRIESDMASLRVYMASLRKKIEADCEKGTYIQTHIGIGYRMIKLEETTH